MNSVTLTKHTTQRVDLHLVSELVSDGAKVLDLGCGDGALLEMLVHERHAVMARGVEISQAGVRECVAKGLSVDHADIDGGLLDYPDGLFDYVILSQTLQTVRHPDYVINEMLRVGRVGIISFPNFGYWQVRWGLLATGRMPKGPHLPYEWYDTPNIHLLTIADFHDLCAARALRIEKAIYLSDGHKVQFLPNLLAQIAIFVVSKS